MQPYLRKVLFVLLRLPAIFVMDLVLQSRFSFNMNPVAFLLHIYRMIILRSHKEREWTLSALRGITLSSVIWWHLHMISFFFAVYTFLFTTKHLITLYRWVLSVAAIICSHMLNAKYLEHCGLLITSGSSVSQELFSFNHPTLGLFWGNYIVQSLLALTFCFCCTSLPQFPPKNLIAGIAFILPTLVSALPVSEYMLYNFSSITAAVEVIFLIHYMIIHCQEIIGAIMLPFISFINNLEMYDAPYVLLHLLQSLQLFLLFKVFWCVRTLNHLFCLLYVVALDRKTSVFSSITENFDFIATQAISHCCDTSLAVIGLNCVSTTIISVFISQMQSILSIPKTAHQQIHQAISIIFVLHSLQNGLTSLGPQERIVIVCRNIILILSIVSVIAHEDIHNALSRLSTTGNINSITSHVRVIFGGFIMMTYSAGWVIYIVTRHKFATWLIAAIAFSIEAIIKIAMSFITYVLNMLDGRRSSIWENFDFYLYWTVAVARITCYSFNILLFFNSIYILLFESFGLTRIILLIIHAYYNLLVQGKAGLEGYKKYCSINNMVKSLPLATLEQLHNFDDVCSVCYQSLDSARITVCNHYFHGICLRSWFHEQLTCPFCHRAMNIVPSHEHQD